MTNDEIGAMISQSDMLQDFWQAVETLIDQGVIRQNEHFKADIVRAISVSEKVKGQYATRTKPLGSERRVMYISLSAVHKEYMSLSRRTTGENGIDKTSLETYLKDKPYYLGWIHSTRFNVKSRPVLNEGNNVGSREVSKTRSAHIIDVELAELAGLFTDVDYVESAKQNLEF
jgi:hypothetical protein